jgi:hypothetical protein
MGIVVRVEQAWNMAENLVPFEVSSCGTDVRVEQL